MDRPTKAERAQALEIIMAEAHEGLALPEADKWLAAVERRAIELHRRYDDECNRPLSEDERGRIKHLEAFMHEAFASIGLGLYLNTDCRGNPVGILTPKTGKYNTMGGPEAGWRL